MGVLRKLSYADAATLSKIKHAKSRTIEIIKAVKEGRQPAPPPGGDDSECAWLCGTAVGVEG
jgi:hypothetical protein